MAANLYTNNKVQGNDEAIIKNNNFIISSNVLDKNLISQIKIILSCHLPMFLFWGNNYTCYYNEAYKLHNPINLPFIKNGLTGDEFWKDKWIDVKLAVDKISSTDNVDSSIKKHFKNFDSYSLIYDEKGNIEGTLIICNKASDHKIFDQLETNEPFTKTILENSPDCIKVLDKNGSIIYMNDNGVTILEANSKNDFLFKKWTSLWDDEYVPLLNNAILQGLNGHVSSFQARANTLKGTSKWWEIIVSPIKNIAHEIDYLLVTSRDITEHKVALLKATDSDSRFETLADNIPNLAWTANADGWIFWYNKKWYEYTGTKKEDMEGWGWQSVHDPFTLPAVMEKWTLAISTGEPFEMIFPLKAADGNFNHFLTRVLPIKNNYGVIEKWFGTNTNISKQIKIENALKESEERFRNLADQSPVWVWLTDTNVNILYSNLNLLKFVGLEHTKEFTGKVWEEVVHPNDIDKVYKNYNEGVINKSSFNFECRIKNSENGIYEWIFLQVVARYEAGEFAGFIGTAINIHQKKEQEFALQQSLLKQDETLAQLNSLLENAPVGFAFFDKEKRYVQINECLADINGVSVNDHIGKNIKEVLGEMANDVNDILNKIVITKEPILNLEMKGQTPREPGVDRYWIAGFYPILNKKNNEVDFIGAVVIEITERKKTEEKIRESEARFRALAETIPQLVWETDAQGNPLYASLNWNEYSSPQLTPEESWKAMVHPDDYENINNIWMHSLQTGVTYTGEVRLRNKRGQYLWHTVYGNPVLDNNDIIVKWIGAFTNINTEKEFANSLKKQVEDKTNDLAKANDFLELKNEELEKMNKELQSFAYISSHDLQEPLRKIQVFSAQIMDKEFASLSDEGKHKFNRIENAAKRMKTLIEDLLAYSRTSIAERKFENVDLNDIITQVKEDLNEEIINKSATLQSLTKHNISVIPFQFRQLIYNLISNAIKFTKPQTAPLIIINSNIITGKSLQDKFAAKNVDYCHITLADNGIGFEQKYGHKIFEVFQRLHGKAEFTGTGIGLAIVKKIVDNHNGFIIAEGELDKGATFNIYLPAAH